MSKKIIYGIYDDDDVILQAVKDIREKGIHINEVYSPYMCVLNGFSSYLKPDFLMEMIRFFILSLYSLSSGAKVISTDIFINKTMLIDDFQNY